MSLPSRIVDTHIHLADPSLPNGWVDNDLNTFASSVRGDKALAVSRVNNDLVEASLRAEIANLPELKDNTIEFVYVQCGNEPALAEGKWSLDMVKDSKSQVVKAIVEIPVPQGKNIYKYTIRIFFDIFTWIYILGGAVVHEFLTQLIGSKDNVAASGVRGGRVVLLGQAPDT